MDIIDAERVQLQLEMSNDPSSSEIVFFELALAELLERQEMLFKVSHIYSFYFSQTDVHLINGKKNFLELC